MAAKRATTDVPGNVLTFPTKRRRTENILLIEEGAQANKYSIRFKIKTSAGLKTIDKVRWAVSFQEVREIRDRLKAEARKEELAILEEEKLLSGETTSFGDLILSFVRHLEVSGVAGRATKRRASTLQKYHYNLKRVLPEIAGWSVERTTTADLQDWVYDWPEVLRKADGQPYSVSSLNTMLASLKVFISFCCKRLGVPNLAEGLTRLGGEDVETPDYCLSEVELREFLQEARDSEPSYWAMLMLGFTTGVRFASLSGLKWSDISFEEQTVAFVRSQYDGHVSRGDKIAKVRELPLLDEVVEALRFHKKYLKDTNHPGRRSKLVFPARVDPKTASRGGFMSRGALNGAMKRICERLGWKRCVSSRSFRQTLNTLLLAKGNEPLWVQAVLGHTCNSSTLLYARPQMKQKRALVKQVGMLF